MAYQRRKRAEYELLAATFARTIVESGLFENNAKLIGKRIIDALMDSGLPTAFAQGMRFKLKYNKSGGGKQSKDGRRRASGLGSFGAAIQKAIVKQGVTLEKEEDVNQAG